MEKNNIVTAPQLVSTSTDRALEKWQETHLGGRKEFFEFLTTPGAERDLFVETFGAKVEPLGAVSMITI